MRRIYIILFDIILVLFVLLLSATFIHGQSYQTFNSQLASIDEGAKWRIGPFRIHPTITINNLGFNNNVYGVREEDGPVSDFMAIVSPIVNIYLPFRNWLILSFSENPAYIFFARERGHSRFNNSYSPGIRMLILRRFIVSGNFHYRKRTGRPSSEIEFPVTQIVKTYDGSIFYELTGGTSFGFTSSVERNSYVDETIPGWDVNLSTSLGRRVQSSNFEFYLRLFTHGQFFVTVGNSDYTFENIESRWRDSHSNEAIFGIRFPLARRSGGTLSLGYRKLIPKDETRSSFSGLISNTSLFFGLGRFSFSVHYTRDFRFSFSLTSVYYIEKVYGAGVTFYLSQSIRLFYSFRFGTNNYPDFIIIQLPDDQYEEILRKDEYRTHSVGFIVEVARNVGIGLSANLMERRSNHGGPNMSRIFVGINFTHDF